MNRWMVRARHRLRIALGLGVSPRKTAAAFALGVFFGFSPFLGFQILVSFAIALLFRLNKVVVFCGLSMNLPWLVVPWYLGATMAAGTVIGGPSITEHVHLIRGVVAQSPWQAEFWQGLRDLASQVMWPFLIGPTVGAAIIGAATYPLTVSYLTKRQDRARPESDQ